MTGVDRTDLPGGAAVGADAPSGAPSSETLWESRVVLQPKSPRALFSILGTDMRDSDAQFAHRMVWTLFPDAPRDRRDGLFLFHVERTRPFTAIVRSRRPPEDGLGGVWHITTRPFAPVLVPTQRLGFLLRAVASRWERRPGERRGRRQDVITAAWHALPEAERHPERLEAVAEAACQDWLARQGERCGFAVAPAEVTVRDYDRTRLRPDRRGRAAAGDIRFGAVTFEGRLTVTDPDAFRRMLADGLGHGRAYGNGLMQIAPAG